MLFACDLHVHIGRSSKGEPVKITAARSLTFENIARECLERKGVTVVGIVDCASPAVMRDIADLIDKGMMVELEGGGLRYRYGVTVMLGAEFETREPDGGLSHHVSFFPSLDRLAKFAEQVGKHVTNLQLSSQQCGLPARRLLELCLEYGGLFVPAHAFTPHKSLYGSATDRAQKIFGELWEAIPAVELGLSADSYLADRIAELRDKTFLSNSDSHSLPNIAREYQLIVMREANFQELENALWRRDGRYVAANFGLDPRLGKYHRTCCQDCGWIARREPPVFECEQCGSERVTMGVLDRIAAISDYSEPRQPLWRAPYRYQVPLQFIPGIGAAAIAKLINAFGSEMAVLHQASEEEIAQVVGSRAARLIIMAREGTLPLLPGGGGRYGKALTDREALGQLHLPGL
ncbi:MAG: TIGR00375 family protein [Armatimonadetes bacterium]|nr:TIGR00375 family protein [Armatimonadota bacterium]